jgi:molybdopterin/thiamine biosynthesis adenylyltransferase
MILDNSRHYLIYNPTLIPPISVDLIGAGAIGSFIALELAKLGVPNLTIWDFDKVEEHNLANQLYGEDHIGWSKIEALKDVLQYLTSSETVSKITFKNEKVTDQPLGNIVFMATDTMKSRKDIFETSLKMNIDSKLMIETRMGAQIAEIYSINPNSPRQIKVWEGSLFSDDEAAEESVCGLRSTVVSTANKTASLAVEQFINWCNRETIENYLLSSSKPQILDSHIYT